MKPGPQLHLPLTLLDSATFDNFIAGDAEQAVSLLRTLARPGAPRTVVYIWGTAETGKTHLLHATCQEVFANGETVLYFPLSDADLRPEVMDSISPAAVYCCDDIHRVAADTRWQNALLGLFENCRHTGSHFIATGNAPAAKLGLSLSDLSSRLQSKYVFQLAELTDENKATALRIRATAKGLELSDEVMRYILRRYPRGTRQLFGLLDRLDQASLAAQRRITIPFLKTLEPISK